jgi:preprotein translocase subunit SecD
MALLTKAVAPSLLCLGCLALAAGAQSGDKSGVKFEMRLAEIEPGKGLTVATVEGSNRKIYLHKEAALTNKDIASALVSTDEGNKPAVDVRLTPEGAQKLAKLTEQNSGKPLAIMLGGKVIFAPTIRDTISDGKAVITGNFTKEEAAKIAKGIKGQ